MVNCLQMVHMQVTGSQRLILFLNSLTAFVRDALRDLIPFVEF